MERINRGNDEKLYQPQIHSERIRALYQISQATQMPMTVLVDMALARFLDDYQPQVGEAPANYEQGQGNNNK